MTELEQQLTNALTALSKQYEAEMEQQAEWVGELQAGGFQLQSAGEHDDTTQKGPPKDGRTHHEIDRRLRHTDQRVRGFRRSVQLARGGFERTFSLIHAEAEQKQKQGHRWDRVEGRIESLIQGRVRSRDRGGPER